MGGINDPPLSLTFHISSVHSAQPTTRPFSPLLPHQEQQTTPPRATDRPTHLTGAHRVSGVFATTQTPQSHITPPLTLDTSSQTELHAIPLYPAFGRPKRRHSPVANITSAANKQPNSDHYQHCDLIPGPIVPKPPPPALPSDFRNPIGGTPARGRSQTPTRTRPHSKSHGSHTWFAFTQQHFYFTTTTHSTAIFPHFHSTATC